LNKIYYWKQYGYSRFWLPDNRDCNPAKCRLLRLGVS